MSDTITVYEKCDHGRLEKHNDPAWPVLNDETGEWNPMCPGGREITLRRATTRPDRYPPADAIEVWIEVDDASGMDKIEAAARLYAAMAPDTCPTCKGWGKPYDDDLDYTADCHKCGGRGHVWPPELRKRLLDGIRGVAGSRTDYVDGAIVDAVLEALWEVGNDN